jgi:Mg-chelatase subunit ChlD
MTGEGGGPSDGSARLRRVLNSLGTTYAGQEIEVRFGDTVGVDEVSGYDYRSDVDPNTPTFVLPADVESYLGADLEREAEYEILLDTLNHLSFCERTDSRDRTERFVRSTDHPASLAAFVHRMVEHAAVTATRLSEYRGLAGAYSHRMNALSGGDASTQRVDALSQDVALVEGLRQLSYTGRVNGLDAAPDRVRGPLSYAAAELARVRDPGTDPDERDEVADRILRTFTDRMYRPRTAERHLDGEMDLPFQEFGSVLPDRDGPVVDDAGSASEAEDDSRVSDLLSLLLLLPFYPFIFLGYDDALETFFRPIPDGPYGGGLLLVPLLLPVFVLWAFTRGVTRRLGLWGPIVDAGERAAAVGTGVLERASAVVGAGLDRCGAGVGAVRERIGGAMNRVVPGDRRLTLWSLYEAYLWLGTAPYDCVDRVADGDPASDFYWWLPEVDDDGSLGTTLFLFVFPALLVVLVPVFVCWLLARTVARVLGVWDRLVAGVRSLRDWFGRAGRKLRRLLDPWRIRDWLRSTLTALWNRLAYARRRWGRRVRRDDWRSNLPADVEPTDVERRLESVIEDGDESVDTDGENVDDGSVDERPPETASIPVDEDADLSEHLLAGSTELTTDSPGEVSIVATDDADDGSVLESALDDLSNLDRLTTSELRARRSDRDARMNSRGASDRVFEEMRDRGLDETIRELFARFPPEERTERRARTGHTVDTRAVAETAVGRLGQGTGLFRRRHHTETGTRCIGVAIDLSGSMNGFEAKVALAALASAAKLLEDTFVAVGFHGNERAVPLVTGPNEPFEPAHLSSIETGGGTPLASGVREARRGLKASNANERALLVITDGSPNVPLDGDGDATADANAEIERCRRDDIAVVGISLETEYGMEALFGDDGYVVVSDDGFAERLLEVYRSQILRTAPR